MTHDVFICHSSNDATIANTVCDALESKHIKCWIAPRDVIPSKFWGEAVSNAIDRSRIIVLIISTNSCRSSQVLMEVERAASRNITILPVRIDDVSISGAIGFFVSSRHWLDAHTPPIKKHLQKLADTVIQLLAQEPVTQTQINIRQTTSTILFKNDSETGKAVQQVITCPRCSAKLRPDAGFCNKCGARVSEADTGEAEGKEKKKAEEARKAQEARERAEKEAEEARLAKEAQEEAEREAEEAFRRVKEAQEKAEKEAEEARIAKEAQEKAEREAEEARIAKEAREKAEKEAEEARLAKEAQEKAEREAEEAFRRAKEAQEKAGKEAEEARKAKEAREKSEREAGAIKTSAPVLHCPKCGHGLRPGTGFCHKCGTRINEVERAETWDKTGRETEVVPSSAPTQYCPKCGYGLRPGAGFCDKCGARIDEAERAKKARERAEREAEARKAQEARENAEKEEKVARSSPQALYCPKCGHELRPGAGFCDRCGTSVSRGGKNR
jgi:uncharacterized OB-fold protein